MTLASARSWLRLVAGAIGLYLGCSIVFSVLGPLLGGLLFLMPTGAGHAVLSPVALGFSYLFGIVPAAIAGQLYCVAFLAVRFFQNRIGNPSTTPQHLLYGWGLGAASGVVAALGLLIIPLLLGNARDQDVGAALTLLLISAFAGACCGRLCSAWASRLLESPGPLILVVLIALNGLLYGQALLVPYLRSLVSRPTTLEGVVELKTYRTQERMKRCGGLEHDCKDIVTDGGAVLWRIPGQFLEGDSREHVARAASSRIIVRAAFPEMEPLTVEHRHHVRVDPGWAGYVGVTIHNRRIKDEYWERAANGEFSRQKAELLTSRMDGLLHFREPKSEHRTSREHILRSPGMAEAYKDLLTESEDAYLHWSTGNEYFVSPLDEAKQRRILIHCGVTALDGTSRPCRATIDFRGWQVEYTLPSQQRHEWRIYDAKVRSLLESLLHRECDPPTADDMKQDTQKYNLRNCRPPRPNLS